MRFFLKPLLKAKRRFIQLERLEVLAGLHDEVAGFGPGINGGLCDLVILRVGIVLCDERT